MTGMTDEIIDQPVDAVARQNISKVKKTGDNLTDGVLSGFAWEGGAITYAFPDSKSDYSYSGEPDSNSFGPVSAQIEAAARTILDTAYGNSANDGFAVEGFTNLGVSEGTDAGATLRYAQSGKANPTAYAYYPSTSSKGGDVWFGTSYDYSDAEVGNYQYATVLHETGHALGLKHGHEAAKFDLIKTTLANRYDSLEYSVMTYHSYSGIKDGMGYTNETYGYPQTYMMADISALQHMYGANFSVNSGATVYSWDPTSGDTLVNGSIGVDAVGNRIFATVWDGGGHDTYDLSLYMNRVTIDLRPGQHSVFSQTQRADLGAYDGKAGEHLASGNIYNALLYKNNKSSMIEDAEGGSGNDRLFGNSIANALIGNNGNDTLKGFGGNDTYEGGLGSDIFVFAANFAEDSVADFEDGFDRIDLRSFDFSGFSKVLARASEIAGDVVIDFHQGDILTIESTTLAQLQKADFLL